MTAYDYWKAGRLADYPRRPGVKDCDHGLPPGRIGEGHVAVRFGDQFRFLVFLDDVDVTLNVDEGLAGEDGWVHMVRDKKSWNCEKRLGSVRIESVEESR